MESKRDWLLPLLILATSMFGAGGCAAAGLAVVSPVASIAGYLLDRGVDRTFAAGLPHVWEATSATLARMEVPLERAERDGQRVEFTATGGGMTISGELTKVTGGMTRVAVTVSGGIRPDKETAKEVLDRVALLLQEDAIELAAMRAAVRSRAMVAGGAPLSLPESAQPPLGGAPALPAAMAPADQSAAAPQLAALQKELETLRAELAALREFRASLVREFGSLRADLAPRRQARQSAGSWAAALAGGSDGARYSLPGEGRVSLARAREMTLKDLEVPESVWVIPSLANDLDRDGRPASSQILRVDVTNAFARASEPQGAAPLPNAAEGLRAADVLAPLPSILPPSPDILNRSSVPPALPK